MCTRLRVLCLAVVCMGLGVGVSGTFSESSHAASSVSLHRNGAVVIAGRTLRCGNARNRLDSRLPNLGVAGPGVVVMNPALLQRHSNTVRLFVFHHECGHQHVGASELRADCWGVRAGVRGGWLSKAGLADVCRSFGNMPETATHPSAKRRCAALEQCYAAAVASQAQRTAKTKKAGPKVAKRPPAVRDGAMPGFGAPSEPEDGASQH